MFNSSPRPRPESRAMRKHEQLACGGLPLLLASQSPHLIETKASYLRLADQGYLDKPLSLVPKFWWYPMGPCAVLATQVRIQIRAASESRVLGWIRRFAVPCGVVWCFSLCFLEAQPCSRYLMHGCCCSGQKRVLASLPMRLTVFCTLLSHLHRNNTQKNAT